MLAPTIHGWRPASVHAAVRARARDPPLRAVCGGGGVGGGTGRGFGMLVGGAAVGWPAAGVGSLAWAAPPPPFRLQEATIAQIQGAIVARQITSVQLVNLYLARIKAYNG